MKRAGIALACMTLCGTAHASGDVDYVEAYHACDEAAADQGFAKAGLPAEISDRVIRQIAGRWQGQDLIVMAVETSTGVVFCMTTLSYRVVHYKFDGRPVILQD
ncbi:hypothetical protein [Aerobium aerolatum]|uniref:Peptidase propeptide and YPEB domain-containing protein n=1 Tax=Aquamicrobium aerolatum DSM 21857 TaxID=1121003 RepID=A0A1I3S594_9HYPH|nr:hypothetical protein [Aquamicrobium aerolatum]SFJ53808.1 hypothetical protein SAMN03080618_03256 [Aquamicrobium aerolatum DSM 21857]